SLRAAACDGPGLTAGTPVHNSLHAAALVRFREQLEDAAQAVAEPVEYVLLVLRDGAPGGVHRAHEQLDRAHGKGEVVGVLGEQATQAQAQHGDLLIEAVHGAGLVEVGAVLGGERLGVEAGGRAFTRHGTGSSAGGGRRLTKQAGGGAAYPATGPPPACRQYRTFVRFWSSSMRLDRD